MRFLKPSPGTTPGARRDCPTYFIKMAKRPWLDRRKTLDLDDTLVSQPKLPPCKWRPQPCRLKLISNAQRARAVRFQTNLKQLPMRIALMAGGVYRIHVCIRAIVMALIIQMGRTTIAYGSRLAIGRPFTRFRGGILRRRHAAMGKFDADFPRGLVKRGDAIVCRSSSVEHALRAVKEFEMRKFPPPRIKGSFATIEN